MGTLNRTEFFAKDEVKQALGELKKAVRRALPATNFAEREEAMLVLLDEAGRSLLEEDLQCLADGFGDRLLVDGVEYKRHERGKVQYYCLGGLLRVLRHSYRRVGIHNGPTVVPLELVAGLAEGATPALAFNVLHGYGHRDMRQHAETLTAAHRMPPPRATLERMAKRLAKAVHEAAPRIEALLRQTEKLPEGARGVCIGLDRTSVPMAEERAASAPAKPQRKRRNPRKRRAPKPFDVNFRMAYVGTVSIVDEQGEALVVRRYGAPACDDPSKLVAKMIADVRSAVRRDPTLTVGTVQDGAPEMWTLTREGLETLRQQSVISRWEEGIDRYHLLERLGAALELIEPSAAERSRQLTEWNERLDGQDSAIDGIERHLESYYSELPPAKRDQLWEHLVYLANNKDRMRYVTLSASNLPIGSGVTESAAKTVVGRRAKNSGQRWSEPGLRGALTLRALQQSERLPRFWSHLSRRYTASVDEAA
jgi:hypothetical protein